MCASNNWETPPPCWLALDFGTAVMLLCSFSWGGYLRLGRCWREAKVHRPFQVFNSTFLGTQANQDLRVPQRSSVPKARRTSSGAWDQSLSSKPTGEAVHMAKFHQSIRVDPSPAIGCLAGSLQIAGRNAEDLSKGSVSPQIPSGAFLRGAPRSHCHTPLLATSTQECG